MGDTHIHIYIYMDVQGIGFRGQDLNSFKWVI